MIFAFATDDRTLHVFRTVEAAYAYVEGIDVEEGAWLFFDAAGKPLETIFLSANERGHFACLSGSFVLEPAAAGVSGSLHMLLGNVSSVEGELESISAVRAALGIT